MPEDADTPTGVRVERPSGTTRLLLGPRARGATDDLAELLVPLEGVSGRVRVLGQQLSDVRLVETLASHAADGASVRALVEERYLVESRLPDSGLWQPGGRRTANRAAWAALMRAGCTVRADTVSGALLHINALIHAERPYAAITSANFTQQSLGRHLNWGLTTTEPRAVELLATLFDDAWDTDFRDPDGHTRIAEIDPHQRWCIGSRGEVLSTFDRLLEQAQHSIRFAFFNLSLTASSTPHLEAAARRGVQVEGVVDGDQSHQSWDAVPRLQDAGVRARYYPGALTGATGRMHHKMAVVDDQLWLSTANLSRAATHNLELGIALHGPAFAPMAAAVDAEIARLLAGSYPSPLPRVVV